MVDNIKSYIKDVPGIVTALVFIVIGFASLMILNGCNLASLVQVKVPSEVREAVAVPADEAVTLDTVDMVWEDWIAYVNTNTRKFESALSDANERYAVIRQLTDIGVNAASQEISGLPGGAVLMSMLSLVGGILLKRPGEDARVAKEKQESYNKGLEVGSSINKT